MSDVEYDKLLDEYFRVCARYNLFMCEIEISEEDFEREYNKDMCVGLLDAKKRAVRMAVANGSYLNEGVSQ